MKGKFLAILVVVLIVYVIIGGVIFSVIESSNEEQAQLDINNLISAFVEDNQCLTSKELERFLRGVEQAYQNGVLVNGTTAQTNWDYASSIFFAMTVITTIGYGNISPETEGGQTFCVCFAILGLPLFLVTAAAIGEKLKLLGNKIQEKLRCKSLENKPRTVKHLTVLALLTLGVTLLMLMPALIFMFLENWTYSESLYYVFITLTTIGFGDYVAGLSTEGPSRAWYRLCVAGWIVIGLAWMAGVISTAQDSYNTMMEKAERKVSGQGQDGKDSSDDNNGKDALEKNTSLEEKA